MPGFESGVPHTQKQIRKIGGSSFALVVCATTKEYRYQVQAHVSSNDVVLEIGSSHGKTTDMISKRTNKVVGVDFINSLVLESKKRYPHIPFFQHDAREIESWWKSTLPVTAEKYSLVFIDIARTIEVSYLLPIIQNIERFLKPRMIVLKSLNCAKLLAKFARGHSLKAGPKPAFHSIDGSSIGDSKNAVFGAGASSAISMQLRSLADRTLLLLKESRIPFALHNYFSPTIQANEKKKVNRAETCRITDKKLLHCVPSVLLHNERAVMVMYSVGSSFNTATVSNSPIKQFAEKCNLGACKSRFSKEVCEANKKYMLAPPFLKNCPILLCDDVLSLKGTAPVYFELYFAEYISMYKSNLCNLSATAYPYKAFHSAEVSEQPAEKDEGGRLISISVPKLSSNADISGRIFKAATIAGAFSGGISFCIIMSALQTIL